MVKLALEGAIRALDDSEAELSEALENCVRLVEDRLSPPGGADAPSMTNLASILEEATVVRVPININPGTYEKSTSGSKPRAKPRDSQESPGNELAPKIDGVLDTLTDIGVTASDIQIFTSSAALAGTGESEYILIQVERLNLEIAVCNILGHATFVGYGLRGPEYWNEATKQDIANTIDIVSIPYRSPEQYHRRLSEALRSRRESESHPDDVQAQRPDSIDVDDVETCIEAHWKALNQFPSQSDGLVLYGPYANGKTTWKAVSLAMLKAHRRSVEENEPHPSPTLTDLVRQVARRLNVYEPYVFRTFPLTEDGIRQSILDHYESSGDWPTITEDVVEAGPYQGVVTWRTIDDALRRGNRGLQGGTSLAQLRDEVRKAEFTSRLEN